MKKKSIAVVAALTMSMGLSSVSIAQESSSKFVNFFFKSPWTVSAGVSAVNNAIDGGLDVIFPANESDKPKANLFTQNFHPSRITFAKDLFPNSESALNGFSLRGAFSREGFRPISFMAIDGDVLYSFNVLWNKDKEGVKVFDPYLSLGFGYSRIGRFTSVTAPQTNYEFNQGLNANVGAGLNLWINDVVGVNVEAVAKPGAFQKQFGSDGYFQYTAGLIFNLGGGKCDEVVEEPAHVCTYKRSQEEEDALIHLREHLND